MNGFLFVALGGALGAAARYGVGLAVTQHGGVEGNWATLLVNVTGSAVMGGLVAWLSTRGALGDQALWLFFGVGLLGAFTTYSSFSKDTVDLIMAGQVTGALVYVAANTVLSIGAFAITLLSVRGLFA